MKRKNNTVEFFRFIFCCIICLHHFRSYGDNTVFAGGYLGVDLFFVVSGFFLMQHFIHHENEINADSETTALLFLRSRLDRILPHHLFSWACMAFILTFIVKRNSFHEVITRGAWELFLLKSTGLGNDFSVNGVSWYLSALLLCSFLIYWILSLELKKSGNTRRYIYVYAPLVFLAVMSWIWSEKNHLNYWTQIAPIFTGGFWRGFSEMGLGCITYSIYIDCKEKQHRSSYCFLITVFEIIGWSMIILQMWTGFNRFDFLVPIGSAVLIFSSFYNQSYLTRILDNNLSAYLGRLSFPMFLNQWIIELPIKTFFPGKPFWPAAVIMLTGVFVFSVFSDWFVKNVAHRIRILLS